MPSEIRTSDGELLSVKLKKVERRRRTTAFLLSAPLLFFIIFAYLIPIFQMLGRSIDNVQMHDFLSNTHDVMQTWTERDAWGGVTSTFFYELRGLVKKKIMEKLLQD